MDNSIFWNLIETTRCPENCQQSLHTEKLRQSLIELEKFELENFIRSFSSKVYSLENWDVWAVAWISRDTDGDFGCGDDAFYTFRTSIVLHGKELYELALKEPDSLSDHGFIGDFKRLDSLSHSPITAYNTKYGTLPFSPYEPEVCEPMKGYEWNEGELSYFNSSFPKSIQKWGEPV